MFIGASPETLLRQASMTADTYLGEALESCKKHNVNPDPVLLAALIRAASQDFTTSMKFLMAQADREARSDGVNDEMDSYDQSADASSPSIDIFS